MGAESSHVDDRTRRSLAHLRHVWKCSLAQMVLGRPETCFIMVSTQEIGGTSYEISTITIAITTQDGQWHYEAGGVVVR
jgi:hypothetical protein